MPKKKDPHRQGASARKRNRDKWPAEQRAKRRETSCSPHQRRYLVGEVGGNPAWGWAILQAWGCKHKTSALRLFERRVQLAEHSDEIFVFDRETRQLIARREKATPKQDREFIRLFIRR
jgi:hypothetical protein